MWQPPATPTESVYSYTFQCSSMHEHTLYRQHTPSHSERHHRPTVRRPTRLYSCLSWLTDVHRADPRDDRAVPLIQEHDLPHQPSCQPEKQQRNVQCRHLSSRWSPGPKQLVHHRNAMERPERGLPGPRWGLFSHNTTRLTFAWPKAAARPKSYIVDTPTISVF